MNDDNVIDRSVIDKIKKLLIKHDGCKKINSEHEAEIALNMAFKMMAKHHLDMSTVLSEDSLNDNDEEIFIIEKECEKYIANELPVWLQNLIQLINSLCNTECILRKYKSNKSAKQLFINFIGEKNDVNRCVDLYKFFKGVSMKLAREHQKKVNGNFRHWRSFSEGFTGRLLEKAISDQESILQKIKQQKQQNSGLQNIDDMEDIADNIDSENQCETFDVIIKTNELVALNRYRTFIKDKIKKFLSEQSIKKQVLKDSNYIIASSFNQGRLAANQYNVSKNSNSQLKLT